MGQAFDDVHAVYCYFGSGIILSGVGDRAGRKVECSWGFFRQYYGKFMRKWIGVRKMRIHKI